MELMEQPPAEARQTPACANCGSALIEPPGRTPICDSCRHQFINYPIPVWIKAFGIGILAVLVFSVFNLSRNISTGIHYKRGSVAALRKNYLTAEKEFGRVAKIEPDYTEGQLQLLMAAYHNHDFATVGEVYKAVQNKQIDDNELYGKINSMLEKTATYYPSDSLHYLLASYNMDVDRIPFQVLKKYLLTQEQDALACIIYARRLFNDNQYQAADSMLDETLAFQPDYYFAIQMKAMLKREEGQFDSSFSYAQQMILKNREDQYAMSSNVRTLLKLKKDDEALVLAKKASALDEEDGYTMASLALAYHYKNDLAKRDAILAKEKKNPGLTDYFSVVKDVISGKEKFRN